MKTNIEKKLKLEKLKISDFSNKNDDVPSNPIGTPISSNSNSFGAIFQNIPEVKTSEDKLKFRVNLKNSSDKIIESQKFKNFKRTKTFRKSSAITTDFIKEFGIIPFKIEFPKKEDDPNLVIEKEDEESPKLIENLNSIKVEEDVKSGFDCDSPLMEIKFGDIKEIEKVGQGSFSFVEKALYIPLQIPIALKKMPVSSNESMQEQVMKELKMMQGIHHDYIITLYGEYINNGFINMALEYIDRGTLALILQQKGKIPEKILKIMFKQILLGLQYLHEEKHIIHRDIKPSNILVGSNGILKISDFGVSGECLSSIETKRCFIGSILYMSPERLQGKNYLFDSDLWSLGIVMEECALGYFPNPNRKSKNIKELPTYWELAIYYDTNEVCEVNIEGFSSEMLEVISKCLQKVPSKRTKISELLDLPYFKNIDEIEGREEIKNWLAI